MLKDHVVFICYSRELRMENSQDVARGGGTSTHFYKITLLRLTPIRDFSGG